VLKKEVKHTGHNSKEDKKSKCHTQHKNNLFESKVMLTDPPAANLDPSTLKVIHVWVPIPCRGVSSLANSFMFASRPYSSNNLQDMKKYFNLNNISRGKISDSYS